MITWKKAGKEMTDDVDVAETLPNADGNFQKRAVLTVPLGERKNSEYSCEVIHSSGEPIVMILNEDEIKRSSKIIFVSYKTYIHTCHTGNLHESK